MAVKPIILLIDPIESDRLHSRKNLEKYFERLDAEVDIREIGGGKLGDRAFLETERIIIEMIAKGEKPALIITDNVLARDMYARAIISPLRNGELIENQDKKWPEGRNIPVAIVTGAIIGHEVGADRHNRATQGLSDNTHVTSTVCLNAELNYPELTNARGREKIAEFKAFVNKALGISPHRHASR